jgi:hypothetical protein
VKFCGGDCPGGDCRTVSCTISYPDVTLTPTDQTYYSWDLLVTANTNALPVLQQSFTCTATGSTPSTGFLNIYDATPRIDSISPNPIPYPGTTPVSFTGVGFGIAPPSLQFSPGAVSWSIASGNTPTSFTASLTPSAPGPYSVTVTSSGNGTQGFQAGGNPPTTPQSNSPELFVLPSPLTTFLQASQPPTPNAVSGGPPPLIPQLCSSPTSPGFPCSSSQDSSFATVNSPDCTNSPASACLITVLKNSGPVTVSAFILSGGTNQIRWRMDADSDPNGNNNNVELGVPDLSSLTGAQVTFDPSIAGDFRIVAYLDANSNGVWDEGEQVGVLRIAVVRATLLPGSIFMTKNTLQGSGLSSVVSGNSMPNVPMALGAEYLLEGGGLSRTIGTFAITVGGVGNLLTDTFAIAYPGNVFGTGTEDPGGPTPMVDTGRVTLNNHPTGGITAFRDTLVTMDLPLDAPAGGRATQFITGDAPTFGWFYAHPATRNPWASTGGLNAYREFAVAFSGSFPLTYLSLNQASWTATVVGVSNFGWKDPGNSSSVTGDTALQGVGASVVQVLGTSFKVQHRISYAP